MMAMAIRPDLLADAIALGSTETQGTHFLLLPGCFTGFIITSDIWEELESQEKGGGEGSLSSALPSLPQTVACPGRAGVLLYTHPCRLSFPALVNFLLPILYQINQNSETQPEITGSWNHMTLVALVKTGRKPPMQIILIWLEKGDRACDRPQKNFLRISSLTMKAF